MPGNAVRFEVYCKYIDIGEAKRNPAVMAVLMAITAADPISMGVDGGLASTSRTIGSESGGLAGLLTSRKEMGDAPPAYLNYLFFDREMQYKYGGFVQMTNAAREDGSNVAHERLAQEVVAEEPGYFYIYLSNDSNTGSEAFFDDFIIQTSESYIVQQIDYYPYGMVAREFKRLGDKATNDLFQGKTYEDLTKWYDFHARQYDAALGRWFGVDPQNQFASPYLAMGNNPVMMVDPDGEWAFLIPIVIGAVVNVATNWGAISSARSFGKGFGMALGYAGVGALQGASTLVGGPAGFALGGAIGGLGNGLMQGMSGSQLFMSAGVGAVSGLAGGTAARSAGKLVGNIASPLLDGLAKGAVGGAAGGFVGGGVASAFMGGNFLNGAIQGAWQGAALGAGIGGAVSSYNAAKNGFNPITGQRTKTWLANNSPKNFTINVEKPKVSLGELEKRQIRGNIYDADFKQALSEWNNVRQQYGLDPVKSGQRFLGDSFGKLRLPDGSTIRGSFGYGGTTNPNGWNIKIHMQAPPNHPKLPPVYLRYLNIPR